MRARRQDIPGLGESHLADATRPAMDAFAGQPPPAAVDRAALAGNVRQLEAAVQRACERALARDTDVTAIDPEHFGARDLAVAELPDSEARPPAATGAAGRARAIRSWPTATRPTSPATGGG